MAGNSVIGALRVDLGLNSAQFTAGLKNAQGALGKFGTVAARGFTAVAAAATVAAGALGIAVKGAIDHADALNKASQKAGVAVEALSRLEYAAKLSDVSLEGLTGGLQKLSKSMADVAAGKGPSTAFAALGVSVKDAAGNLRDGDVVFADIADRFSRIEDGATKTALAMAIFGKSGAELIPLLNSGRDGLKQMADESDRLGFTISTKTARGAERFNDTLTKIGGILQGVVNKVMTAALPALQSLADTLASPQFAEAAEWLATTIVGAVDRIVQAVVKAIGWLKQLGQSIDPQFTVYGADGKPTSYKGKPISSNIEFGNMEGFGKPVLGTAFMGGWGSEFNKPAAANNNNSPPDIDLDTFTSGVKKAQEVLDPFAARFEDLRDVLTETVDPFSQMKLDLTDLETMFKNGRIGAEQFGSAVQKTIAGAVGSFADLAGSALNSLSQIFEGNKAIAVASAIVNGIGSVAKTLETYGVTPWGIAAAGIAGATAALNVANILSTTKSSKSMPGGSSGGASAAAASGAGGGTQQAINLTVRGSGAINVDDFVKQLTEQIADGGHSALIRVMKAAA